MSTDTDQIGHLDDAPRKRWFLPALVIGWGLIAFGAWSALRDPDDANPLALVVHLVAFDLGHDLIVAPALLVGGWLIGRLLPPSLRGPVRAAGAASALVVVFSVPLVKRWGQRPTNSSTLPLDYGRNVVIVIVAIWSIAAITVITRALRAKRR